MFANQLCFTRKAMTDFPGLDCQQRCELFVDVIKFTTDKVQKALVSLKMHTSPGPDDIPSIPYGRGYNEIFQK